MAISNSDKLLILKRACVSKKWLKGFPLEKRKLIQEENFEANKEALMVKIEQAQKEVAVIYKSMAAKGSYYEYQLTEEFKSLRELIERYFGEWLYGTDVVNADVRVMNLVRIP
jgi:hypothetical protein